MTGDFSYDGLVTKRFAVRTYGCQMNEHDSERIAAMFEADGMEATDDLDQADVIVLNTCCIRENADNKLYGTLGHLKSLKAERPGVEIVVGGCLAQKDADLVRRRAPHVDVVFGTHNVGRATALLAQSRASGPVTEIVEASDANDDLFASALPVRREVGYQSWITIQVGCDNSCAFCIVPSVRGPERSRSFGDVVAEVEGLAAQGVTEVTLLGQNVNSYGRDLALGARSVIDGSGLVDDDLRHRVGSAWLAGPRRARPLFADLLDAVGSVDGIRRVRYTSPHPKDLHPETIEVMGRHPAVCEHLHLPLQSGSDRVLAAMHRGYTADRYLERLVAARASVDDLAVSTDIIVGFPGETDDDFEATLEVSASAGYDAAYTFIYSPRSGTEAAEHTDRFVDHAVAVERMTRLRAVIERSSIHRNEARIGRIEEVLVEGPSKRDPSMISGRTRQNKLVHFAADRLRPGSYATVEITGATMTHLRGEFHEVIHVPTHRTRLSVAAAS